MVGPTNGAPVFEHDKLIGHYSATDTGIERFLENFGPIILVPPRHTFDYGDVEEILERFQAGGSRSRLARFHYRASGGLGVGFEERGREIQRWLFLGTRAR